MIPMNEQNQTKSRHSLEVLALIISGIVTCAMGVELALWFLGFLNANHILVASLMGGAGSLSAFTLSKKAILS